MAKSEVILDTSSLIKKKHFDTSIEGGCSLLAYITDMI